MRLRSRPSSSSAKGSSGKSVLFMFSGALYMCDHTFFFFWCEFLRFLFAWILLIARVKWDFLRVCLVWSNLHFFLVLYTCVIIWFVFTYFCLNYTDWPSKMLIFMFFFSLLDFYWLLDKMGFFTVCLVWWILHFFHVLLVKETFF